MSRAMCIHGIDRNEGLCFDCATPEQMKCFVMDLSGQLDLAEEDLARLKACRDETLSEALRLCDLVKRAEWGTESFCPWCNAQAETCDQDGELYGEHARDCPAFNAPGSLR